MLNRKAFYFFIYIFFLSFYLNSTEPVFSVIIADFKFDYDFNTNNDSIWKNQISQTRIYQTDINYVMNKIEEFEFKKTENLFRRAEILFFGSLTIISFGSWMCFSIYNTMMYGDTFGNLRRDQFLIIYAGAGIISFSVAISDIFIKFKLKTKGVEIY
jgi:hypothetical protein